MVAARWLIVEEPGHRRRGRTATRESLSGTKAVEQVPSEDTFSHNNTFRCLLLVFILLFGVVLFVTRALAICVLNIWISGFGVCIFTFMLEIMYLF